MPLSEILTHLGEERSQYYNSIAPPVIQTSNFAFDSPESFAEKISNEFEHHIYTRGNNPTVQILRKKIAALEKTEDALITSSGVAAVSIAITSQLSAGDHIICVSRPYDWTRKLIENILARFGVEFDFVDGTNLNSIRDAIKTNTKVIYLESPNSKTFEVQDLRGCVAICQQHKITSIIDNSHCSPIFQNPIDFGIDLVVHSGTKYLNGHSDVVLGVICGSEALIRPMFQREFMTFGPIISPLEASMVLRGLRTLDLRVRRSDATAMKIAQYLEKHPRVSKVYHPLLPSSSQYQLAKSQMSGNGGLVSVEIDARNTTEMNTFCSHLKKFLLGVSWGGYESLYIPFYPFYDRLDQNTPSVPFNFIRFYIGLEDFEYLKSDLKHALDSL
ncbi:MAG: aminotransferase class I/II-fold pyridoxal phosphate-dependent enzyme [Bacteroidia bacterium]|nr:aminotransferase class I/II-fold pyridoxal phosphate-dependent enzyme [Bacteroidia bacterium]